MFGALDPKSSLPGAPPEHQSKVRTVLRYTPILLLIAMLYAGFVLWSRWQENRDIEAQEKAQKQQQERDAAERAVETLGGEQFEILTFYATPVIHRGEQAQLCYGVSSAKSVRLDPPAASMWPSASRCFNVSPTRDTTYTLTAEDGHGVTKTAVATIKVR
jgi:hypothetical protein